MTSPIEKVSKTTKATPSIPSPPQWWCHWQHTKGLDPRRVSLPDVDLRGKWIILTGGNSGIGREAALQFVKWGANIVLGCRQPPPHEPQRDAVLEELGLAALNAGHGTGVIEWWECDMSNLASVEAFGRRWLALDRPLDILANNAGMGGDAHNKTRLTADGFEILHQVIRLIFPT